VPAYCPSSPLLCPSPLPFYCVPWCITAGRAVTVNWTVLCSLPVWSWRMAASVCASDAGKWTSTVLNPTLTQGYRVVRPFSLSTPSKEPTVLLCQLCRRNLLSQRCRCSARRPIRDTGDKYTMLAS
jgi:hypothetical protein